MTVLTDRAVDPVILGDLAQVRLGQAFLSRALNEVKNEDLVRPSALPGWSRAHVVAHVGYNARALNRLVDWAATGIVTPMYSSPLERDEEIELGSTLAPRALRHLSDHAAIALDVAWRDLPQERWSETVKTARGREVPVSETVWMRTREVWLHAVDLGTGSRLADVPGPVGERILSDVLEVWSSRGEAPVRLVADDSGTVIGEPGGSVLEGRLSDLLGWATGRSVRGVRSASGDVLPAPRWI
ncbi:MAG: maleylpyruvate isomerase [Cryobacterium sp.]|jgi:maleylpyruvate isomerase|nr:maleylpyruvate isomerase [Cryobacterium sp.]